MANAQIVVESKQSAEFYVKNILVGTGIEVGKVRHYGMEGGIGKFDADESVLGISSGLVLSTGHVDSLKGPNNVSDYTSKGKLPGDKKMQRILKKGDKDLNTLCRMRTTDVSIIEFDFVPTKNIITFNYVFGSEEYPEYVNTRFNDVFGFYLSGPGIKKRVNLAVLPDGITPISINSINHRNNEQFYRSNKKIKGFLRRLFTNKQVLQTRDELNKNIQLDGFTTVLTVKFDVIPYKKYHLKIAIGDASDEAFDSGVFMQAKSFSSISDSSGKFYGNLKKYDHKTPNIDSIFGIKSNVDSIPSSIIGEEYEITDLFFDIDSYGINNESRKALDRLGVYLKKNTNLKCVLYGYTDNTGSAKTNQELSEKRALSVKDYLMSIGIDESRITYYGNGIKNPKSDNLTEAGRARNRRVEIILEE